MNKQLIVLGLCLTFVLSCQQFKSESERREEIAASSESDIFVGIAWPFSLRQDGFREGIQLAQEEVNQAGGIDGRFVKLIFHDDMNSIKQGKIAAQSFSENLNVVAVIGHQSPQVSQVASLIYEYANVVMICPGNSSTALTRTGFKRIFRLLPSEIEIGGELANRASEIDGGRVMLIYQNDDAGRSMANAFESKAEDLRLRIAMRVAFDQGAVRTFERAVKSIRSDEFDVVVLATETRDSLLVLATLKENGLLKPTITSLHVEHEAFVAEEKLTEGVSLATVFYAQSENTKSKIFVEAFEAKFDKKPGVWAALAYDSMHLLADAFKRAGSSSPGAVSKTLRETKSWMGVSGEHSFDDRGQVVGKKVFFKTLREKKFVKDAAASKDKAPPELKAPAIKE
jgi:branched-chain amino acid transport system substrate-binding protein